ncbi:hypothetical protein CLOM_g23990 [Closterium sp. NIES-68]|nr:hypothetical protein CLOM_g23990 [Closterium sp. NIES-68]GJP84018.1 hypothetical protein CLOP_g14110 [Closterium sp. NIES-67]
MPQPSRNARPPQPFLLLPLVFIFVLSLLSQSSVTIARSVPRNLHLVCEPGCLHNGTCKLSPKIKEPECECQPYDRDTGLYFRGKSCQTEAVRCNATWWCENGGKCVAMGAQGFLCSCPHKFQGSKCQTPVVACGTGLWCANGGVCVFSEEANATICKCPSTHTGASCQTLVEPQDFGPSEQLRTNFTSPLIIPSNSTLDFLVDERDKYFHTFFALLGALVFVWVVSLCFVYHSHERRRAGRAIAVVGVLEAPPPSRLDKQQQRQQQQKPLKHKKKQQQQQNGKVNTQEDEQQKHLHQKHLSGEDLGSSEAPLVTTSSCSSAGLTAVPIRRNPSSGVNSSVTGIAAGSSSSSSTSFGGGGSGGGSYGGHMLGSHNFQHHHQQQQQHGSGYVPPEIMQDVGNESGGDRRGGYSSGAVSSATDAEVAALFAVPQDSPSIASPSTACPAAVLPAVAEATAGDASGENAAAGAAAVDLENNSQALLLSSLSSLIRAVDSGSQMGGSDSKSEVLSVVMDSLPGGGVEEDDMAEELLCRGEESSGGGMIKSSRRKRAGTGDDVRLLF